MSEKVSNKFFKCYLNNLDVNWLLYKLLTIIFIHLFSFYFRKLNERLDENRWHYKT